MDDALSYLTENHLFGLHKTIQNVGPEEVNNAVVEDKYCDSASNLMNGVSKGDRTTEEATRLLVLSAFDEKSCGRQSAAFNEFFHKSHPNLNNDAWDEITHTLIARRTNFRWRCYATFKNSTGPPSLSFSKPEKSIPIRKIAFLFTGQGAQYAQMGVELCHFSVFERSLRESDAVLRELGCQWSLFGKNLLKPLPVI